MLWVWIMFASLDLIRRNINQAVSDKLGKNTHHPISSTNFSLSTLPAQRTPHEHKRFQQRTDNLSLFLPSCRTSRRPALQENRPRCHDPACYLLLGHHQRLPVPHQESDWVLYHSCLTWFLAGWFHSLDSAIFVVLLQEQ
jgi:hypothetical protein